MDQAIGNGWNGFPIPSLIGGVSQIIPLKWGLFLPHCTLGCKLKYTLQANVDFLVLNCDTPPDGLRTWTTSNLYERQSLLAARVNIKAFDKAGKGSKTCHRIS